MSPYREVGYDAAFFLLGEASSFSAKIVAPVWSQARRSIEPLRQLAQVELIRQKRRHLRAR